MLLLGGLKRLLHEDGLTIKGAQKLLREKGIAFVADLSQPLDDLTVAVIEGSASAARPPALAAAADAEDVEAVVMPEVPTTGVNVAADAGAADAVEAEPVKAAAEELHATESDPGAVDMNEHSFERAEANTEQRADTAEESVQSQKDESDDNDSIVMPSFRARPRPDPSGPPLARTDVNSAEPKVQEIVSNASSAPDAGSESVEDQSSAPKELTASTGTSGLDSDMDASPDPSEDAPAPEATSTARTVRVVDVAPVPPYHEIDVSPSIMSSLADVRMLSPEQAHQIKPLVARLTRLHASMVRHTQDAGTDG